MKTLRFNIIEVWSAYNVDTNELECEVEVSDEAAEELYQQLLEKLNFDLHERLVELEDDNIRLGEELALLKHKYADALDVINQRGLL